MFPCLRVLSLRRSSTRGRCSASPPPILPDARAAPAAQENIDFQSTILSRFDLIFIIRDVRNEERDQQIARHVMALHRCRPAAQRPAEGRGPLARADGGTEPMGFEPKGWGLTRRGSRAFVAGVRK